MSELSSYHRIIAPEAGAWTSPVRAVLRGAEVIYRCAVALRNARYDRIGPRSALPVPVISVGNITVGGTGKTPVVIDLARRLERMGYSPAVVSRGYRAVDGEPNDEERLVRASCPGVVCVSDPDRVMAAQIAHQQLGADVVVLDDAFQHRRIARDLDIVLIDATCPFGYDHLLPRGLLREPVDSLRRADLVILTRYDQASRAELSRIEHRLRGYVDQSACLKCTHGVTGIERLDGTPVDGSMNGKRAVLFAGIAHPQAFVTTVRSLGIEVVGEQWWPDHHHYRTRDVKFLLGSKRFAACDMLLTTQKDAVKLAALKGIDQSAINVLKIAIDFVGDSGTILQVALEKSLARADSV